MTEMDRFVLCPCSVKDRPDPFTFASDCLKGGWKKNNVESSVMSPESADFGYPIDYIMARLIISAVVFA